ncbi:phytoene desaturase family protein [Nocardioides sp. GCM10027113]|uniref:phytoene desaturase family protein n=1 Tax=unclassified Nocardioides TaxID=2615069 RepID=UPI0036103C26
MARVVVVGGGFAGMAVAARLAKLRHEVTLLERAPVLGGALAPEAEDGFSWDASATSMLLPAVVRDLFRKSGRPVERELELVPLPFLREHRFEDGSSVRVPGGSRAAQLTAFDELGPGLGQRWADHVAAYADDWEVLRRNYLEVPWEPERPSPPLAAVLGSRETLRRRLRRDFRDERLRLVAGHRFVAEGHDLRDVPAWLGVHSYVEQRFGGWTVEGGMGRLAGALADRLATRRVTVHTGTPVRDLVVREGRVVAVATGDGSAEDTVDADVVVVATDPRRLPALAPHVARTTPAIPPVVCHVGLKGPLPDLGPETVLHGDPMLVVRTGGRVPQGNESGDLSAWTVHGRGRLAEDVLVALARRGIDLRDRVVVRVDRSPRELVERWGGSPMGLQWQGRGTVRHRLGPTTPIPGVYAAGAHATPGGGLPFVGLSAALVAQSVGPADGRAGDPA